MPNSAKYIKWIIQGAQILVPIILIALIAFDISKIVMSGQNFEEELPKQRKKIITRIVVALVFFFLPVAVSIIINLLKTSGGTNVDLIKQIDCLFR